MRQTAVDRDVLHEAQPEIAPVQLIHTLLALKAAEVGHEAWQTPLKRRRGGLQERQVEETLQVKQLARQLRQV